MFTGEYYYNIDEKGRMFVPTEFRSILGDKIIVNRGIEKCLYIYSIKEWEKISSEVSNLAVTHKNNRQFSRMFFSGAFIKEIDAKGRVNIENILIEYACLEKECVFVGAGARIEIWNKESWLNEFQNNQELLEEISETIELRKNEE
ncbi:MAG: division/cell wall cluster transcriptional repressor MraZ [Bacilli bacterium]|nr:division/cell wall cluster transcriptional repressor MraZ [Bacilli bacterium]